jgi:hypothetical protein
VTRKILALAAALAALPLAARADSLEPQPDLMRRTYAPRYDSRYRPQARQGLLLSLGAGGGSLYLSPEGPGRFGAADVDFRIGYGFSDQFQTFMDLNADTGSNYYGDRIGSWSWTLRGQLLLIGDRAGNGLNVNFGAGFGGLTYDPATYGGRAYSPTGFALAGGLSYDARITPWLSLSPEFFVTWHQIPNVPGLPDDVSSIYGIRFNLLWYLH